MSSKGLCNERNTPKKQADFRDILAHHIHVCSNILEKCRRPSPYVYIDCFGGPGVYRVTDGQPFTPDEVWPEGVVMGSPVIFQELSKRLTNAGLEYKRYIWEEDRDRYEALVKHIGKDNVFNESAEGFLNRTDLAAEKWQYGLLYCDDPMEEETIRLTQKILTWGARHYLNIDVMIYTGATLIKRWGGQKNFSLFDLLRPIKKKYWAIRELADREQYTFLIGTNYADWADWRKKGFHLTKSDEGREILYKANLTKKKYIEMRQYTFLHTELTKNTSPTRVIKE